MTWPWLPANIAPASAASAPASPHDPARIHARRDADELAGLGVARDRPHRQADLRLLEQHEQQAGRDERDDAACRCLRSATSSPNSAHEVVGLVREQAADQLLGRWHPTRPASNALIPRNTRDQRDEHGERRSFGRAAERSASSAARAEREAEDHAMIAASHSGIVPVDERDRPRRGEPRDVGRQRAPSRPGRS